MYYQHAHTQSNQLHPNTLHLPWISLTFREGVDFAHERSPPFSTWKSKLYGVSDWKSLLACRENKRNEANVTSSIMRYHWLKFLLSKASNDILKLLFRCFFLLLDTYQLSKKSAPRPHLEGTLWHNSYHCCKKQRWLSSFLQPLKETIAALRGKKYAPTREHK